jgi:hypothetical protein
MMSDESRVKSFLCRLRLAFIILYSSLLIGCNVTVVATGNVEVEWSDGGQVARARMERLEVTIPVGVMVVPRSRSEQVAVEVMY